jgi:hypothetical protein
MPGQVVWVLGDLWMASYMTVFDAGNMRIGFACDKETTCKGGKRHLKGDARMERATFEHVAFVGASFSFCAFCFYYVWMVEMDIWRNVVEDDSFLADGDSTGAGGDDGISMQVMGDEIAPGGYQAGSTGMTEAAEGKSLLGQALDAQAAFKL